MGRVVPIFFISQSFNIKGRKSSGLSYNNTLSKHFSTLSKHFSTLSKNVLVQETKRAEPEWKRAADEKRQRLRSEFKYSKYININSHGQR